MEKINGRKVDSTHTPLTFPFRTDQHFLETLPLSFTFDNAYPQ